MMKILVTGFEPFGGSSINPSEQVVRRLQEIALTDIDLATAVLPVKQTQAGLAVVEAITHYKPQAILCLGEASQRPVISVERIAVNLMDYRIPDNQGNQVTDTPVVEGGPAAYFATLPVQKIMESILKSGAPAELSLSAGSFLCNQVMYHVLHITSRNTSSQPGPVSSTYHPSPNKSHNRDIGFPVWGWKPVYRELWLPYQQSLMAKKELMPEEAFLNLADNP